MNGRYVTGRLQWYQCRMQASSLGWYLHGQPAPLLLRNMFGKDQLPRLALRNRVWPHTHTPCEQRHRTYLNSLSWVKLACQINSLEVKMQLWDSSLWWVAVTLRWKISGAPRTCWICFNLRLSNFAISDHLWVPPVSDLFQVAGSAFPMLSLCGSRSD